MRGIAISVFSLAIISCGQGAEAVGGDVLVDSRLELVSYQIRPLLVSDIKKCHNVMRIGGLGNSSLLSEAEQKMFRLTSDAWRSVHGNYKADSKKNSKALIKGKFVEEVPGDLSTIFAETDTITDRSHKCGEVVGKLAVSSGLMSFREGINLAEEANPDIFEEMGVNREQLEGTILLKEMRVLELSDSDRDTVISCVAISQAQTLQGSSNKNSSDLWAEILNNKITNDDFSAMGFSDENQYWESFVLHGADEIETIEGYTSFKNECSNKASAAFKASQGVKR